MAFSLITEPYAIQPVYNKLSFYVYDPDYINEPDFKYVFKTYVNTVLVDTSKLYPLSNGRCLFDASKIIANYVSNAITVKINSTGTLSSSANTNELKDYYVECYIEYTDANGDTQEVLRGGGNKAIVWNGVYNYIKAAAMTATYGELIYALGSYKNFLNWKYYGDFSDYGIKIRENSYKSISFFAKNANNAVIVHKLIVKTVTKTGTEKVFEKTLSINTGTSSLYRLYHWGIGIPQLNATTWTTTTIPSGYTSTISSIEDDYYSVALYSLDGGNYTRTTKELKFKIIPDACFKFDHYTAVYQAPLGGWGYIDFENRSDKRHTVEQSKYKNILSYEYRNGDRETKIYDNKLSQSIILNTDWLVDQLQVDEVMDLLSSPCVYLVENSNNFNLIPVSIKNSTYEYKKKNQDKLFQYQVEFDYAYNDNVIYKGI